MQTKQIETLDLTHGYVDITNEHALSNCHSLKHLHLYHIYNVEPHTTVNSASFFQHIKNLVSLQLKNVQLSLDFGQVSKALSTKTNLLQTLQLHYCQISGVLDFSFLTNARIERLDLRFNMFTCIANYQAIAGSKTLKYLAFGIISNKSLTIFS